MGATSLSAELVVVVASSFSFTELRLAGSRSGEWLSKAGCVGLDSSTSCCATIETGTWLRENRIGRAIVSCWEINTFQLGISLMGREWVNKDPLANARFRLKKKHKRTVEINACQKNPSPRAFEKGDYVGSRHSDRKWTDRKGRDFFF